MVSTASIEKKDPQPDRFEISVVHICCDIRPRIGSLFCKIPTSNGTLVPLKLDKNDRISTWSLKTPIEITSASKIDLFLSKQLACIPLGKPRTLEIAYSAIVASIGKIPIREEVVRVAMKVVIQDLDNILKSFTVQTATGITLSTIRVTLNSSGNGRHFLRAISGGHKAFVYPLEANQNEYQDTLHIEPDCSLKIIIYRRRFQWSRRTEIATGLLPPAEALDIVPSQDSPDSFYHLRDDPKIELSFAAEDTAALLNRLRQLLGRNGTLVDRLLKYQDVLSPILEIATTASQLNPIAQAVMGSVNIIFEVLKKRAGRNDYVLALIKDLALALDHLRNYTPETLEKLQQYMKELDDLSKRIIVLVESYIRNQSDKNYEECTRIKSQLADWVRRFATGAEVATASKWTEELKKLVCAHYEFFLQQLLPKVTSVAPQRYSCLDGTCEIILDKIVTWLTHNTPQNILWLNGFPGSGKSSIALTLIERLSANPALASTFFFHRGPIAHTSASALNLWITVAADLSRLDTVFGEYVVGKLKAEAIHPETNGVQAVFERLISDPIAKCKSPRLESPIFVVVDGLDECYGLEGDTSNGALLDATLASLQQWAKLPKNFKLVITSRFRADIENVLSSISYPMALSLDSDNPDIHQFVDIQCQKIAKKLGLDKQWLNDVSEQLAKRANGLFIYAVTIMELIDHDPDTVQYILKGGLGKSGRLHDLYKGVIDHAFPQDKHVRDFSRKFKDVAGAIVLARNPADTETVILDIQDVAPPTLKAIRYRLQSVLDHRETNVLRFRHQSFVDYLTSDACRPDLRIHKEQEMKTLTLAYLVALNRSPTEKPGGLRFDIGRLKNPFTANPAVSQMIAKLPTSLVHASLYLGQYLDSMPNPDASILKAAGQFLYHNFLSWLEVLSLVGKIDAATENLLSLKKYIKLADKDLSHFTQDALDFVRDFKEPISISASHIYISALSFTPQMSAVLARYKARFPKVIALSTCTPEGDFYKGPISAIISVSTAPTGYIAVVSEQQNIIRFWNPATGSAHGTPLRHDTTVTCFSFSPDGKHIVCGSEDRKVRLWVVQEPVKPVRVMAGHKGAVTCVLFLRGGSTIVSGGTDGMIRIWDPPTGKELSQFTPHEGLSVASMAELSDNRFVSFTSVGNTFRVLEITDAVNGSCITAYYNHIFPMHGSLSCVACSKTAPLIACGSMDQNTRIWNTEAGNEMAIFPRSSQSDAVDSPMKRNSGLWNTETENNIVISALSGHSDAVIGSMDHNIRIWNTETGKEMEIPPLSGHSDAVTCIAIHGQHIASGSADHTIKMWNLETGRVIMGGLYGHSDTVTTITFSSDGSKLISGSADQTVRVWDISETGSLIEVDLIFAEKNTQLDSTGWIRSDRSDRLVWLPESERSRLCWGRCTAIIDGMPWKRLHFPRNVRAKSGRDEDGAKPTLRKTKRVTVT